MNEIYNIALILYTELWGILDSYGLDNPPDGVVKCDSGGKPTD